MTLIDELERHGLRANTALKQNVSAVGHKTPHVVSIGTMHIRVIGIVAAVGLGLGAVIVDARAETQLAPKAARSQASRAVVDPSGPGTPTTGLRYVSIGASAFRPIAWADYDMSSFKPQTATFTQGIASITLPDAVRIRELACFGKWDPAHNENKKIRLRRLNLATGTNEILGAVAVHGGSGMRRLQTSVDHVVDNFEYTYQLELAFNRPPDVTGCRIGYEPG